MCRTGGKLTALARVEPCRRRRRPGPIHFHLLPTSPPGPDEFRRRSGPSRYRWRTEARIPRHSRGDSQDCPLRPYPGQPPGQFGQRGSHHLPDRWGGGRGAGPVSLAAGRPAMAAGGAGQSGCQWQLDPDRSGAASPGQHAGAEESSAEPTADAVAAPGGPGRCGLSADRSAAGDDHLARGGCLAQRARTADQQQQDPTAVLPRCPDGRHQSQRSEGASGGDPRRPAPS